MKKHLVCVLLLLAACNGNQPSTFTITPEVARTYPKDAPAVPSSLPAPAVYPPPGAFRNAGDPEQQIDASSELVTMSLGSRSALAHISNVLSEDPPTRAELNCAAREALCAEAKLLFAGRGIPVSFKGRGDAVTLVYERVVTRDCDNRYVDNSQNQYNLHMHALGCSVRGNMVQMISDKQQIVNPTLLDLQDGKKSAQDYDRYQEPPQKGPVNGVPLGSIVPQ